MSTFDFLNARKTRFLTALLGLCFLLIPAIALAVDKNQIVQMTKLGLDDRAIIGAIDSTGDDLSLSEDDLSQMKSEGVSDAVINHLRRGGYVEGAAPDAPPTPPQDGLAPAPAPAPADGETDEEREEREAEARALEEEIERRAEERERERQQEREREARLGRLSAQLPEANRLLDQGRNMEAARIFLEILSLDPDFGSEPWYEATYGLGRALYQQGILSGATTPVLEILMAGADRRHFMEAFRMLRRLTAEIGYRPPVLEELTGIYIDDLPQDFRDSFNYYMGKFFFDYNRSDLAVEYLEKVSPGAADYPESLYVMGVALLDPAVQDFPGALTNFQNAILAGEAEPGGNEEILQLGYLALARTWYEIGLYDVALFYYQKIPSNSSRHSTAMFERAWTYFLKNDFRRALGIFHTLQSPYFSKWYYPDLFVLEATVYLNLCKFQQSQIALAEFQRRYLDLQPRLKAFLQETTEPVDYWRSMMTAFAGNPQQRALPRAFVNAVLDDLEFYNIYNEVKNLQIEKRALESNIATLGEFGQAVLDRVEEQLRLKIEEGGILVRQKLSDLDQELTEWELQATRIAFEIDAEERRQIENRLMNPDWEPPVAQEGTTFLVVADDWQSWRFEGEYWLDEVPNYRSSLRTECIQQ